MDILKEDIEKIFSNKYQKYAIREYLTIDDSYICIKHLIGTSTPKGIIYEDWNTYKKYSVGQLSYVITLEINKKLETEVKKEIQEFIAYFKSNIYEKIKIDFIYTKDV